jgi:hypothetical protein
VGHRIGVLEGQAVVGAGGQPVEALVEGQERLPRLDRPGGGQPDDDQLFQIGDALGLPDLVGQADQQVLRLDAEVVPRGVGGGEAGQLGRDAEGEQQVAAGRLVLGARGGQLGEVQRLADVVGGGPEEDGVAIERDGRIVGGQPVGQVDRDVVDGAQVCGQARRRVQAAQQVGGGGRERAHGRIGEGPFEEHASWYRRATGPLPAVPGES